ncbi:serine/threonine-protein kinase 11-interacting protein isoform X2 [Erinaceus europaeus]|uniref:Serine/threonine-protein kinase 11-interacting protein n=1 Tax=Erinaceus europaeus TaxID=9365 RepID=A0ABM3XLD9_ERIEU|nr:serine/threonine-protein kinase 11-interacting protein isoform X2 [Erinaceus europaeus]
MTTARRDALVRQLAGLLREAGDTVLSGQSTLSVLTATLQQLNHLFELHLGPWAPGQTGFMALPSHPADSPVILQLQFLFDMLQKTLSLKLVHVPGLGLPAPVKIFPFKSLRKLELRAVPLHCLRGLRGVYSQLETLICSRCIQALAELLSACGGDLCSALPWLALLSADFSYNALTALDSSLGLLSALRSLNLSHNHVQDCEGFLKDLSELHHLDVSYNHLQLVPRMGPSGAALGTLILRGNELQNLHGLEQLKGLRHLDLAYNLLEAHRELWPLGLLAELRKLYLDGNPLSFHPQHRAATACHLAPCARDATPATLTSSEVCPGAPLPPFPPGNAMETSGGPDVSDSPSSGAPGAQPPLHKVKSRVRVRRASISEPSDTDPEPRTLDPSPAGWFAQQHRELELMNSFRERFGQDWLQYRSHLEPPGAPGTPAPAASTTPVLSTLPQDTPDMDTEPEPELEPSPVPAEETPQEMAEGLSRGPEQQEEEDREEQGEEEEQWQSEVEAELCHPMLVCPLEGPRGDRGRECFLKVTSGHLLEVELRAGRVLERLERQSLEAAEVEPWTDPSPEASDPLALAPVLLLRFSYIRPDRHLRRYAVLEPDAQAAVQELLAVLTPASAAEAAQQPEEAGGLRGGRLQCLRCGHEFTTEEPRDDEEAWRFWKTDPPTVCPNCGSDHVVLLAPSVGAPNGLQGRGEGLLAPSRSPSPDPGPPGPGDHVDGGAPSLMPDSQDHHSWGLSPPPERRALRAVDHRLRLFLDVEVFSDAQEEFQCCVKVPLAMAGQPGECPCLVVVSDHRLYALKVTGEICGPPAGWLQPSLAVPLQDLSGIELGLAGQSLRLEWAAGAGSCVLLPREPLYCQAFLEELTDVLESLPPARRVSISVTKEEVTPNHRLWPLLDSGPSSEPPRFFYLRVLLLEGLALRPMSLLLTLSTLYLLEEAAPEGARTEPPPPATTTPASVKGLPAGPGLWIHGEQPLSCLSSVLCYRLAPGDLRLVFYDEVSRLESFWAVRVAGPEQLAALLAWIRGPWEELFSIGLRIETQEAPDPDG